MDAGNPLLAVVGGPEAAGEKSGLEALLLNYNLVIGSTAIVDPVLNFRGQPYMIYAPILSQIRHPVVDSLVNRAVLMPRASPITVLETNASRPGPAPKNQAVLTTAILRTSNQSWGETDVDPKKLERGEKDEPGPMTVGAAVTDRPTAPSASDPKPRLVVFSSRFLADNLFLEVEPTNLDILINAINWLRGQAEMGGIAPRGHVALTLAAEPALRARLILVPTVMAVLLIIGLGLTTYMARRE
jgi:hypothetical protein